VIRLPISDTAYDMMRDLLQQRDPEAEAAAKAAAEAAVGSGVRAVLEKYRRNHPGAGSGLTLETVLKWYSLGRPATETKRAAQPPTRRRRARKLTLREAEKQAGRPVASVTVTPDDVRTFTFGEPGGEPAKVDELDKWLERHPEYARSRPSERH
jgi:hypothetical protein